MIISLKVKLLILCISLASTISCSMSKGASVRPSVSDNSANGKKTSLNSPQEGTNPGSKSKGKVNGGEIDPHEIMADYPKQYCNYINALPLRADVAEESSFYCKNGLPTADMRDLRARVLASKERRTPVQYIINKSDESSEISEFAVIWAYYVADRPFNVKARPFFEYIAAEKTSENIHMKGVANRRDDTELTPGGLHLWSADMNYTLTVQATQEIKLAYTRSTQYNLYQVQSGNEEMGLGIEHLTDPNPENFQKSIMINYSFNDGSGYNDGKGETIVLNLLHVKLSNRGFPQTAAVAFDTLANFLADSMFEGFNRK